MIRINKEENYNQKKELGIYIHIPFCKSKCYYCDFLSFKENINNNSQVGDYIKKILLEIDSFDFSNYEVTTIYIGGGTPSYIDENYIEKILNKIKEKIKKEYYKLENIEITIEMNPGTINKSKLQKYKEIGINRISLGLQTINDELLKKIGRIHTFEEFLKAYNLVKQIGFNNISFDLMIGLPDQKIKDIKEMVDLIKKLDPNHVSVYSLILEEGTKLEELVESNKLELPSEEDERKMYWYVKNKLELLGYNHYEISNFSKIGKESKHNMNCWEQKEYVGFGLGAHSYIDKTRYFNEQIDENTLDYNKVIEEKQTINDKKNEYMLLSLRKLEGVNITKFKEKFNENPIFIYKDILEKLTNMELVEIDLNNIKLTNKGIDFANLVWQEFV